MLNSSNYRLENVSYEKMGRIIRSTLEAGNAFVPVLGAAERPTGLRVVLAAGVDNADSLPFSGGWGLMLNSQEKDGFERTCLMRKWKKIFRSRPLLAVRANVDDFLGKARNRFSPFGQMAIFYCF